MAAILDYAHDLVNWYGGEARLKRNYKMAQAAERRLWQVFDEVYGSIAAFFQQVYEPRSERVTNFCHQLYARRRRSAYCHAYCHESFDLL
ncbi:MAG: hypothetical protein IT327_23850 [Anaerolineae bacterium]|nr:hypothetical protein [Anaerolineae bacterium]